MATPRDTTAPLAERQGTARAAAASGRPRDAGPGRPLVRRVVLANAILVVVLAAGCLIATRSVDAHREPLVLVVLAVAGICAIAIINYLIVGPAGRLLTELTRAMETIHKGELDCRVEDRWRDADLRRLSLSFNDMCQRLGDESLSYAERQLGSIEEERRRIGRELHDETSQTLAATLVRLDLCDKAIQDHDAPEAHAQIVNCKALLAHTMDEIKLLVYDLRPVMLDDFGLVPTLRWYIQSHLQGAGPDIVTDFDEADLRLPGTIETALYRITQEALANAVRHADATKVHVRLTAKPGFVSLAVIDNGKGFDPGATWLPTGHPGVGLLSLKERAELSGGTVNIESAVGRGTRLYVVIPLTGDGPIEERA
jgi:two-component system, NarL family, sensor histidine kinase UhpB